MQHRMIQMLSLALFAAVLPCQGCSDKQTSASASNADGDYQGQEFDQTTNSGTDTTNEKNFDESQHSANAHEAANQQSDLDENQNPAVEVNDEISPEIVALNYPEETMSFGFWLWKMDDLMLIRQVSPGSEVEKQGLSDGAILLTVNEKLVEGKDYDWVFQEIRSSGDKGAQMTVLQNGEELSVHVKRSKNKVANLGYYYKATITAKDLVDLFSTESSQTVAKYIAENKLKAASMLLERIEFQSDSVDPEHAVLKLWLMCHQVDLCDARSYQLENEYDEKSPSQKILEQAELAVQLDGDTRSMVADVMMESTAFWLSKYESQNKSICNGRFNAAQLDTNTRQWLESGPFIDLVKTAANYDYAMWRRWAHTISELSDKYKTKGDYYSYALLRLVHHIRMTLINDASTNAVSREFAQMFESSDQNQFKSIVHGYVLAIQTMYDENKITGYTEKSDLHKDILAKIKSRDKELSLSVTQRFGIYPDELFHDVNRLIRLHAYAYSNVKDNLFLSTMAPESHARAQKELQAANRDAAKNNSQTTAGTYRYMRNLMNGPVEKAALSFLLNKTSKYKIVETDERWVLCISHSIFENLDLAERMFTAPFDPASFAGKYNIANYVDPADVGLDSNRYFLGAIIRKEPNGRFLIEHSMFVELLASSNMQNPIR